MNADLPHLMLILPLKNYLPHILYYFHRETLDKVLYTYYLTGASDETGPSYTPGALCVTPVFVIMLVLYFL